MIGLGLYLERIWREKMGACHYKFFPLSKHLQKPRYLPWFVPQIESKSPYLVADEAPGIYQNPFSISRLSEEKNCRT